MNEVMGKIKTNQIKFKKNLDGRIRKLIHKILQVEPQKRPSCQEILESNELIQLAREFEVTQHLFDDKSTFPPNKLT